jgi:acetaldehyde dehydrogenase (acetylating)
MNQAEMDTLARGLVTAQRLPNPAFVGKAASYIAENLGISVPDGTRVLIAPLAGVGRDYPLSIEKLSPILSWYGVKDWREGCERCMQILRYGGMGHTMSIHSKNEDVILQFGLKKPAFRICVNTSTTHGSIGLTTGLDPAMTLGCGGWGGNITSDNITPRHLLNIKRLAYEVRPLPTSVESEVRMSQAEDARKTAPGGRSPMSEPQGKPSGAEIPAEALESRIDRFLAGRGLASAPSMAAQSAPTSVPADFVCEGDVRDAIRAGRKVLVGEKTILTPSARDLGESEKVFVYAG